MDIIKEIAGRTVILRTRTHADSLEHIVSMFSEARRDFPFLSTRDISIKHYGGMSFKGTYGIEFQLPEGVIVPPTYEIIKETHLTL